MKLTVLISGAYNNLDGAAEYYDQGEDLVTGQLYGQSLIQDGFAIYHDPNYKAVKDSMPPSTMEKVTPAEEDAEDEEPNLQRVSDFGSLTLFFEVNNVTKDMINALIDMGVSIPQDLSGLTNAQLMEIPGMTKTIIQGLRKKAKEA